ncbi:hypothetical protein DUQ00_00030 [Salmonella bongori]|nr:hypothetical protein [Salmonella bongori]EGE4653831.1 IS3 family transposase [Salmonella bongori serovar 40:z35:- str. 95-0123]EGE4660907.1 IS3 family transposase [Salmonella bongori serovar 48:i:- str. 94-0708]ECC9594756.1 hypothetical protein [Salmonella bongori]ECG1192366.1 hypothetical protein [Salmonella bongori]
MNTRVLLRQYPVEKFFHSLKMDFSYKKDFANKETMRTAVFNYIECG